MISLDKLNPRTEAGVTLPFQCVISYGLSSYGYDIRLSPVEFRIFCHIPGTTVDPKLILKIWNQQNFTQMLVAVILFYPLTLWPWVALERLKVPDTLQ